MRRYSLTFSNIAKVFLRRPLHFYIAWKDNERERIFRHDALIQKTKTVHNLFLHLCSDYSGRSIKSQEQRRSFLRQKGIFRRGSGPFSVSGSGARQTGQLKIEVVSDVNDCDLQRLPRSVSRDNSRFVSIVILLSLSSYYPPSPRLRSHPRLLGITGGFTRSGGFTSRPRVAFPVRRAKS